MLSTSLSVLVAGALLVLGRPVPPPVDLTIQADTLDDGPHVYWRDARNAVVFHLCDGTVETSEVDVSDTLRFTGLCADSATQYRIPAQAPAVAPADYDGAPRILALSDIHGEYDAFVDILQRAGIIDRQLRWTWGNGHVVITGDVFDRGTKVTECLWLIYRLEQEARHAGGRMHMVLGNHELLVLQGDNRYVRDKYLNGIARRARVRAAR